MSAGGQGRAGSRAAALRAFEAGCQGFVSGGRGCLPRQSPQVTASGLFLEVAVVTSRPARVGVSGPARGGPVRPQGKRLSKCLRPSVCSELKKACGRERAVVWARTPPPCLPRGGQALAEPQTPILSRVVPGRVSLLVSVSLCLDLCLYLSISLCLNVFVFEYV